MQQDRHVVGVVGGIELSNVKQAPPAEAIAKVARIKTGLAVDGHLARDTVHAGAVDVLGFPTY